MISKQTGWSAKSNALYEIMKQLDRMTTISSKWLNGDFHQEIPIIEINIYDFSVENWTVVDADAKIIELAAEFAITPFTQQHIIFPEDVQISYLVETELNTILAEDTENSIELVFPILPDTDAIIEWYADWSEANSITQTQIDLDAYDACTSASETDRGRFATEENENSFINLEIV